MIRAHIACGVRSAVACWTRLYPRKRKKTSHGRFVSHASPYANKKRSKSQPQTSGTTPNVMNGADIASMHSPRAAFSEAMRCMLIGYCTHEKKSAGAMHASSRACRPRSHDQKSG